MMSAREMSARSALIRAPVASRARRRRMRERRRDDGKTSRDRAGDASTSNRGRDARESERSDDAAMTGGERRRDGTSSKAVKRAKVLAHLSVKSSGAVTPARKAALAFGDVDEADHCETPFRAYRDAEPFLFAIAKALKREKRDLRIYDPYYCEGSMVAHLAALGFESVYNRNEDFYERVETKTTPEFDVLVTNPPYSGDHFKRILSFARACNKPWLLLLPNFVCRKSYYAPCIGEKAKPLFLIPDETKPYRYWAPGRQGHEIRAKGTTPFETFWYIEFAGLLDPEQQRAWWLKKYKAHSTCDIPALDEALPQQQRLQKRPNPAVRAAMRAEGKHIPRDSGDAKTGVYYDPEKAKKKKKKLRHDGSRV